MPATEKLPRDREWVYFLAASSSPAVVKIGKAQELRWRVLTLQYMSPVGLRLIGAVTGPAGTERVLHAKWKAERQHGEWFLLTERLRDFIATLPKGEMLPVGSAERWASETGVPLLPKRRRSVHHEDPEAFEDELAKDQDITRHWNREFAD